MSTDYTLKCIIGQINNVIWKECSLCTQTDNDHDVDAITIKKIKTPHD